MTEERETDGRGEGKGRRAVAVVMVALAAIAAVVVLIALLDGGEDSDGDVPEATAGSETPTKTYPDPDPDSRASAKNLKVNLTTYSSIATGDDEDWFVYRAPGKREVYVEVAPIGPPYARTAAVEIWEGTEKIANEPETSDVTPLGITRELPAGERLFVKVSDSCGDEGCSVGGYRIALQVSNPG